MILRARTLPTPGSDSSTLTTFSLASISPASSLWSLAANSSFRFSEPILSFSLASARTRHDTAAFRERGGAGFWGLRRRSRHGHSLRSRAVGSVFPRLGWLGGSAPAAAPDRSGCRASSRRGRLRIATRSVNATSRRVCNELRGELFGRLVRIAVKSPVNLSCRRAWHTYGRRRDDPSRCKGLDVGARTPDVLNAASTHSARTRAPTLPRWCAGRPTRGARCSRGPTWRSDHRRRVVTAGVHVPCARYVRALGDALAPHARRTRSVVRELGPGCHGGGDSVTANSNPIAWQTSSLTRRTRSRRHWTRCRATTGCAEAGGATARRSQSTPSRATSSTTRSTTCTTSVAPTVSAAARPRPRRTPVPRRRAGRRVVHRTHRDDDIAAHANRLAGCGDTRLVVAARAGEPDARHHRHERWRGSLHLCGLVRAAHHAAKTGVDRGLEARARRRGCRCRS